MLKAYKNRNKFGIIAIKKNKNAIFADIKVAYHFISLLNCGLHPCKSTQKKSNIVTLIT